MTNTTKINPKLPKYYPNGGGSRTMTAALDELHEKEMAALLAKQAYDLHALQEKHRTQKTAAAKAVAPKKTGVKRGK